MANNDEILLTAEMARMVRVRAGTARAWRSRGGGPPYSRLTPGKRGRAVYRRSDVLRWLEARRATSTADEVARPGRHSFATPAQSSATTPEHASRRGGAR